MRMRHTLPLLLLLVLLAPAARAAEEPFVAIAIAPKGPFPAGSEWHYGTGWSAESGNAASLAASDACETSGGFVCWTTISMRGGCVALAMGERLVADEQGGTEAQQGLYAAASAFGEEQAMERAMTICQGFIRAGIHQDRMLHSECSEGLTYCASDAGTAGRAPVVQPAAKASGTRPAPTVVERRSGHVSGERFRDPLASGGEGPEMVVVPAGSFLMGSPASEEGRLDREGPQHRVTIARPFAAGVHEVTFAEWDACAVAGGCGGYRPNDSGWGRGGRPVINVSWEDAQGYVTWLSVQTGETYRLLSESEWEYAARAGTTTPFHTGRTISTDQANYDGRHTYGGGSEGAYRERTVPVGSFGANGFGLHDVHGNVWEWVEDCWNGSYAGAPADGGAWESGNCAKRVLRGGSWVSDPRSLRAALRNRVTAGRRNYGVGFRVARTLTP